MSSLGAVYKIIPEDFKRLAKFITYLEVLRILSVLLARNFASIMDGYVAFCLFSVSKASQNMAQSW